MSTVSQVIAKLQKLQDEHGDISVFANMDGFLFYPVFEEKIRVVNSVILIDKN